jgi:hypothetical protein
MMRSKANNAVPVPALAPFARPASPVAFARSQRYADQESEGTPADFASSIKLRDKAVPNAL